jgi:alkylation response protein AidB-like acyl-CoA dehydrogenase
VASLDSRHRSIYWTAHMSKIFTIFEGTSEIQRLIIGRAATGLDVR